MQSPVWMSCCRRRQNQHQQEWRNLYGFEFKKSEIEGRNERGFRENTTSEVKEIDNDNNCINRESLYRIV
jgi:hypothetical protein